jgi:hypothetical protein
MSRRCRKITKSQTCPVDVKRDDIDHVLNVSHIIWNTVVPITMELKDMSILGEAFFPLRALCYKAMAADEKKKRTEELAEYKELGYLKRNPHRNAKRCKASHNGAGARTRKRNAEIIDARVFGTVCCANAFEFAKWMKEKRCVSKIDFLSDTLLRDCCELNRFEMVKWLISEFHIEFKHLHLFSPFIFLIACVNGHLDFAKWLYSTFREFREINLKISSGELRRLCIEGGHAHVVEWLDEITPFPYLAHVSLMTPFMLLAKDAIKVIKNII